MNKTLFRMEWKSAWKLLLIFILILAMYFSIMLTMFDPELGSALAQFEKLMQLLWWISSQPICMA